MITHRHTTLGRTPLDEWSARRRDLYLTTHNTDERETSMSPVGFETHNPSKRVAADRRRRPCSHRDRQQVPYNTSKWEQVPSLELSRVISCRTSFEQFTYHNVLTREVWRFYERITVLSCRFCTFAQYKTKAPHRRHVSLIIDLTQYTSELWHITLKIRTFLAPVTYKSEL